MNKRHFIKNITGASLGAAALAAIPASSSRFNLETVTPAKPVLDNRRNPFPNVPLLTHEGKIVRFYDDLIKGKTVFINFMYARCGDICPGMTANLKQVQNELGDRIGKDIFMYSITLETEHDTPEMLKAYAELFHVKPGWLFLTGKKADIEHLRKQLGFSFSDPTKDKDRTQHIGVVKFGIEPLHRWGMSPALGNPKYIAEYLRWMEPNGSRPRLSELLG